MNARLFDETLSGMAAGFVIRASEFEPMERIDGLEGQELRYRVSDLPQVKRADRPCTVDVETARTPIIIHEDLFNLPVTYITSRDGVVRMGFRYRMGEVHRGVVECGRAPGDARPWTLGEVRRGLSGILEIRRGIFIR